MQIFFFKHAKLERATKFGTQERGNANLGTQKKSFEKARGNAEREEEMKERGHVSREGPAGTCARLCVVHIGMRSAHVLLAFVAKHFLKFIFLKYT